MSQPHTASSENLPIHEDKTKGVYVKGLLEVYVGSTDEVYEVMRRGSNNRVVAYTSKWCLFFFSCDLRFFLTFRTAFNRHERRELQKSLYRHVHHHPKERRYRCSQKWKTLPCRFGRFREGKPNKNTQREKTDSGLNSTLFLKKKLGWQNWCLGSDPRRSQKDQQISYCPRYGHQCPDRRKGTRFISATHPMLIFFLLDSRATFLIVTRN